MAKKGGGTLEDPHHHVALPKGCSGKKGLRHSLTELCAEKEPPPPFFPRCDDEIRPKSLAYTVCAFGGRDGGGGGGSLDFPLAHPLTLVSPRTSMQLKTPKKLLEGPSLPPPLSFVRKSSRRENFLSSFAVPPFPLSAKKVFCISAL